MNFCVGGVLQVDVNVGGSEVVVTYLDFVAMAFIRAEVMLPSMPKYLTFKKHLT